MKTVCLWVLAGGLAFGLAGCGTTPKSATRSRKPNLEPSRAQARGNSDLFPDAEAERRIEAQARFAAGVLSELNQDPDGALEHFYRSALADPAHEDLVLDVARRLLQQKEADRSIQLLTRATAQPNPSGLLYAYLGVAYAQAGKNDLAIAAHRAAIQRMPHSSAAYQNLIQLYAQTGQTKEALLALDEAEKQPDLDAQSLLDLAELLTGFYQTKKLDPLAAKPKVIELLTRAAALKPDDPVVLEKLGDGFRLLGESARAEAVFEQLVQGQPKAFGARAKLAELYLRNNDPKRAAQQWEAILREVPTDPMAYYFLGNIAQGQKDFAKAEECFQKVLLLGQPNVQVYCELALTQINLNKPEAALATLDKGRDRFPRSFPLEFYTGLAYARQKRYAEALKHYTAAEVLAEATEPNLLSHLFYYQVGSACERNQDRPTAEKYFRKCLAIAPDFAEALNYLGYMWAERGERLQEAKAMIEKAVKLEPENAAFLDSLGWVLFKLNQPKEGLDYLLQAIKHSEEPDPTLYDHLGDVYAALKHEDEARAAWRKSLSIEANEEVKKKLEAGTPVQPLAR